MMALERAGVDFALKTYVAFAPWVDPAFEHAVPQAYAFVDVDLASCRPFSDEDACLRTQPAPPALIMDFARAARTSGARVVIVDVEPPAAAADRAALYAALAGRSGPWFVAPMPSRPNFNPDEVDLTIDWPQAGQPALASGKLRLAPMATTTDPAAGDGVVRHFPILARVRGAGTEQSRWLPTAPYLAAMLGDRRRAKATDCLFYRSADFDCARTEGSPILAAMVATGQDPFVRNRILYSLPGLSDEAAQSNEFLRARYLGRYERLVASRLMTDGHFDIPEGLLAGKIVVLGTSAAQGEDWHPTPIGPLAGPEIVLNATRAFAEFTPLRETVGDASLSARLAEAWSRYAAKFGGTLLGALIMTPGWLAIYWLAGRPNLKPAMKRLASVSIFLLFLMAIIIVEVVTGVAALRRGAQVGQITDLLTPLLGLGLEGYAEGAKAFTDMAERGVLAVFGFGARLFSGAGRGRRE
ncbi:MAG: CHASE2 domain-containing protein [Caulobacteraceae bacterium]|nr:CHASE2 domain-containing protein [Caulobacteraceae bacterium]